MKKTLAVMLAVLVSGCASIVHQTTQQIPVKSDPPGASVTVACGDVFNDPKLVTPTVVTVHRKSYACSIGLSKEGYEPSQIALARTLSGWYVANILFGGIIGFIVDAANGAMYNRTPGEVSVTLAPTAANGNSHQH
jgi:hypothetical protein